MNNKTSKVLVIGGGAAGLMAAGTAAARGLDVTVLERNQRMARKILVTGKGRCNITNNCTVQAFIQNVPGNGRFLYSAVSAFTPQDVMAFFEENGLPVKTERGNRVFPDSDRAMDVVDALVGYARNAGCRFVTGRAVSLCIKDGVCTGASDENGNEFRADSVILCTGGLSYPLTGSTGDGYEMAKQAGHTVMPLRPSLVPLVCSDTWCGGVQGLSLRNCSAKVIDTESGKCVFEDFGEMIFTHFGISGPIVLSASAHMRDMSPGRYRMLVDLKPALTPEQLDARLVRDIDAGKNKEAGSLLAGLLPRSLCPVIAELAEIPMTAPCHSVTRRQRQRLGVLLKSLPIHIDAFRPVEEAVITAGGVHVKEVDSRTMESKLVKGLYFAGETLDIDAYTGGFNLQCAFSTGVCAGNHV